MVERIDRKRLVSRHNPRVQGIKPIEPLAVGNGEFVYTVDVTGMQSFPEVYRAPLSTQSQWGWEISNPDDVVRRVPLRPTVYPSDPCQVGYPVRPESNPAAYHWRRQNPHRLQLGQVGMTMVPGNSGWNAFELSDPVQILDLWKGLIESHFSFAGDPTTVTTGCHPTSDQIGVRVVGNLVLRQNFAIVVRFPSAECTDIDWWQDFQLAWNPDPTRRITYTVSSDGVEFRRHLNHRDYVLRVRARLRDVRQILPDTFLLYPQVSLTRPAWEISFGFFPIDEDRPIDRVETIHTQSRAHWEAFWLDGGAIELSQSRDPRAPELERRTVLSQYLTAIHCAGSLPPQETGLAYNSWFGKFHLEMTWWHAAHFFLWNRGHLADGVMQWYRRSLDQARALARSQGYAGARWPKTVGPDGEQTPSPIAPLLLWQQPHPIFLAELSYRSSPSRSTLEAYHDVVVETARFMADRLTWDSVRGRYVLAPPLIPAQETHDPEQSMNPAFELAYWDYALGLAMAWLARMGIEAPPQWADIRRRLAPIPTANGVYLAHEGCRNTYTQHNRDHPSMLGTLGILPGEGIDRSIMRNTLQTVIETWRREELWGWDFPMMAMTAARLGEPEWALEMLLMDTPKNRYLINGHNYQSERLLTYLPGNGGLLSCIAMMAAGWFGSTNDPISSFPHDGSWTVVSEGLGAWL